MNTFADIQMKLLKVSVWLANEFKVPPIVQWCPEVLGRLLAVHETVTINPKYRAND